MEESKKKRRVIPTIILIGGLAISIVAFSGDSNPATQTTNLVPPEQQSAQVFNAVQIKQSEIDSDGEIEKEEKKEVKQEKQTPPTLSNDNYYTNSAGNEVHSPAYANSEPAGASARCRDGTYSFSQSRRGTCSHHGGVAEWL